MLCGECRVLVDVGRWLLFVVFVVGGFLLVGCCSLCVVRGVLLVDIS